MSLARQLARQLFAASRRPLPLPVAAKARLHLADTLGISLAAMRVSAEVAVALRAAAAGAARGDARVIGSASLLPPVQAAFVNSAAAHALDFDDVHDLARLHVSAVTLPAALAAADVAPAGAERLLHAVAIGNDVMVRLGLSIEADASGAAGCWLLTQLIGYLGAAVAAGIVLGLDEDQLVSALGLAYMQAAGGKETAMGTGSNVRAIYPGFAAAGGTQAALLAHAGMTAPDSSLDGRASFYRIYLDRELSPEAVSRMLALEWPWLGTDLKPWPCCRLSHPYVAAALVLAEQIGGAAIAAVDIHVNASAATLCRPLEARIRPQTLADAKYSVPFMTAFALVHRRVDLSVLDESALRDERVLGLAGKVRVHEGRPDRAGLPVGAVAVRDVNGRLLSAEHELAHAWTAAAVRDKFNGCMGLYGQAAGTPDSGMADSLWNAVMEAPPAALRQALLSTATG